MRSSIIIAVLFFCQFTAKSQNWERYDQALDSLEKLLNSSSGTIRANAIIDYGILLVNKAWNATNQGEFAMAYETYGAAMELFENPETENFFRSFKESSGYEKRYWFRLANIYFNYGLLMSATQNRKERLRYHRKTYEISKMQNDTLHLVYSYGGMSMLYLQESKADSALAAVERALSYDPKSYDYASYPMLLYFKGSANMLIDNYQLAKSSFQSGIEYSILDKSKIHLAINTLGLSKAYAMLNERDSSYHHGMQALNMLKEIKEIQMLKIDLASGYENLYEHFQKFEQQDSAFKYLQLASDQRAFFTQKTIKNLAAFQQVLLEKEMQSKEFEKIQLKKQAKTRTYLFLSGFFVLTLIGGILYHSNRQKQKTNKVLETTLSNLKATQTQLIQQEKLASLGQLTAGIAHEIKNPLNFVNNFSEVSIEMIEELREELANVGTRHALSLQEGIPEILNDIEANLRKIHEHGSRADGIVKSMLQHSRGGSGKMEPTNLNTLIKEYTNLAFHGMRAGKNPINVTIDLQLDEEIKTVPLVEEDFSRVLLNLCNNAFDAMRETAPARPPMLIVRTKLELKHVLIEVEDNGPGIPDEIKDKILQPFFTTKKGTEGTGLGLSITNDIVKAHGGELNFSSSSAGTLFKILLNK